MSLIDMKFLSRVIIGDCRDTLRSLIAAGVKVQCVITSPPYYGLRDYGTATWDGGAADCQHVSSHRAPDNKAPAAISAGVRPGANHGVCRKCGARRVDQQIGLESTPQLYVDALVEVFSLVRELMTDDATLWLNLGDSYANVGKWGGGTGGWHAHELHGNTGIGRGQRNFGVLKPKDLIGIPWMAAFALRDKIGFYLRQEIIWHKPNPLHDLESYTRLTLEMR